MRQNDDRCPICKRLNHCQVHHTEQACWCTDLTFSESLNKMIKPLPRNCICSTCAKKFGALYTK